MPARCWPGALKAVLLLNTEPDHDAAGAQGSAAWARPRWWSRLSPFKANMDISDVLLPIAPFTETSGHLCQRRRARAEFPCRGQARWAIPARPGRCCACWPICWVCKVLISSRRKTCWPRPRGAQDRHTQAWPPDAGQRRDHGAIDGLHRAPSRCGIHLPAGRHRAPCTVAAADSRCASRHGRGSRGGRMIDMIYNTGLGSASPPGGPHWPGR
jgi:hypothetical protein